MGKHLSLCWIIFHQEDDVVSYPRKLSKEVSMLGGCKEMDRVLNGLTTALQLLQPLHKK